MPARHARSVTTCLLSLLMVAASASAANPTGLVGHWGFDETTGTATADQGPNDLDGTLLNGAQFSGGALGGGLLLDGLDDYVDVTTAGAAFRRWSAT